VVSLFFAPFCHIIPIRELYKIEGSLPDDVVAKREEHKGKSLPILEKMTALLAEQKRFGQSDLRDPSCRRRIEPMVYLTDVLRRLPSMTNLETDTSPPSRIGKRTD